MAGISSELAEQISGIPQRDTQSHRLGDSSFTSVQLCSCESRGTSFVCGAQKVIMYTGLRV